MKQIRLFCQHLSIIYIRIPKQTRRYCFFDSSQYCCENCLDLFTLLITFSRIHLDDDEKKTMRKTRKSSTNNPVIKLTESFCRTVLDSVLLNDDYWWCMVILVVESSEHHNRFVKMFNEAAESGKRKSIFNLSYKKLISDVKRLD